MTKYKKLTDKQRKNIINEAKMMFFAHRDCLWNRFIFNKKNYNPNHIQLDVNDGYYGEFFGIFRALAVLGYGYMGADCPSEYNEFNLKAWAQEIIGECLEEEVWQYSTKDSCLSVLNKYRALVSKR